MNIFSDFHHSGLGYAQHLLLEKRLGHNLYFPIGQEWFEQGYWHIARPYKNSPDTIKQYLALDERYIPKDGTVSLNNITGVHPDHYEISDHAHNYTRKAVTWEQFMSMDIDLIIASIPDHYKAYRQMRDIYKSKARVICQMGNMFAEVEDMMVDGTIQNLMASTNEFETRSWVKSVFYHQEIDESVFKYREPTYEKSTNITSFVNLLPRKDLYEEYMVRFGIMSDHITIFKAYGAGSPDGCIQTIQEIADIMASSHWGWHIKPGGDGFGHVIYDWAAIGRPIIANFSDYKGSLASELLVDGVTAINLEARSFEENREMIKRLSHPEPHKQLCLNMRNRYERVVDYKKELSKVEDFLGNLR